MSIPGRDSTAAMLVRAGFVVVLVLVNVSGFRPVLARTRHVLRPLRWASTDSAQLREQVACRELLLVRCWCHCSLLGCCRLVAVRHMDSHSRRWEREVSNVEIPGDVTASLYDRAFDLGGLGGSCVVGGLRHCGSPSADRRRTSMNSRYNTSSQRMSTPASRRLSLPSGSSTNFPVSRSHSTVSTRYRSCVSG